MKKIVGFLISCVFVIAFVIAIARCSCSSVKESIKSESNNTISTDSSTNGNDEKKMVNNSTSDKNVTGQNDDSQKTNLVGTWYVVFKGELVPNEGGKLVFGEDGYGSHYHYGNFKYDVKGDEIHWLYEQESYRARTSKPMDETVKFHIYSDSYRTTLNIEGLEYTYVKAQ